MKTSLAFFVSSIIILTSCTTTNIEHFVKPTCCFDEHTASAGRYVELNAYYLKQGADIDFVFLQFHQHEKWRPSVMMNFNNSSDKSIRSIVVTQQHPANNFLNVFIESFERNSSVSLVPIEWGLPLHEIVRLSIFDCGREFCKFRINGGTTHTLPLYSGTDKTTITISSSKVAIQTYVYFDK